MRPFNDWMKAATVAEQRALAAEVGSSQAYLYQISSGARAPSAELAAAIEEAVTRMHTSSLGRLPLVYRTDLALACRQCAFARACLGDDIVGRLNAVVDSEGGHAD